MQTDRELLERAAAAAGIEHAGWWDTMGALALRDPVGGSWNPLTDDGDALRLAVRLRIDLQMDGPGIESPVVEAVVNTGAEAMPFAMETLDTGDPYAATRRAIVRAAAAMLKEAYVRDALTAIRAAKETP